MNSISAVQLNYIIYRYLMASGFVHTDFNFKFESGINNLPIDGDSVPHAALIELVQTGLLFKEMQANANKNNADDEDYCFLPITDLITKNVSELQKIVKGKKENPSASELGNASESGFVHTAFNFKYESGINNLPIDGDSVRHTTLIELVQTGLLFKEMQANANKNNADDEDFFFLPSMDLIAKNVSKLQKIVKSKKETPSATEPKDLAKLNLSASESDESSSDDSQYVASLRDDTQDLTEDEPLGQVNDWISSYHIDTSGTGIAGYVGSGFIVVGGDGRALRRDKFGEFTVIWNEQKLTIIQDEFVVAIAGIKQLGQAFLDKVMKRFGSGKKRRSLHSFADFCNLQAEVDRIGPESEFVIMALGYSQGDSYVYCTTTKKCRIAKLGSIHGVGSAFETIKKHFKKGIECYEGDEKLERNQEAVVSLLKGAFSVGCILEDSCGGTLDIAILRRGEGAILRNEGHLIKIMSSSSSDVIKNFLKLCILVAQKGRKYSEEEHDIGIKMLKKLFPLSNEINIIGVIRSKSKKSKTIIYMVSFLSEGDLRRMAVAYGEQRLDDGVWLRVEQPNRQVLSKYAKKIMNNHYF